jgi:ubiquinone biosynthesis protein Coq4
MKNVLKKSFDLRDPIVHIMVRLGIALCQTLRLRHPALGMSKMQMRQLPVGTLGYDLAHFLDTHDFDVMDKVENHDMYHVLLGYKPDVVSEIAMQFFLLANGRRSIDTLGMVTLGGAMYPFSWRVFVTAWRDGRAAHSVVDWELEHLIHEPTAILQSKIYNKASTNTEMASALFI